MALSGGTLRLADRLITEMTATMKPIWGGGGGGGGGGKAGRRVRMSFGTKISK